MYKIYTKMQAKFHIYVKGGTAKNNQHKLWTAATCRSYKTALGAVYTSSFLFPFLFFFLYSTILCLNNSRTIKIYANQNTSLFYCIINMINITIYFYIFFTCHRFLHLTLEVNFTSGMANTFRSIDAELL